MHVPTSYILAYLHQAVAIKANKHAHTSQMSVDLLPGTVQKASHCADEMTAVSHMQTYDHLRYLVQRDESREYDLILHVTRATIASMQCDLLCA